MIRTEAIRKVVRTSYSLPLDVQKRLNEWNSSHPIKLELIFDPDHNKWQIYRIKHTAAISDLDVLHWQMSAPTEGTAITTSIFDWLRKYDQSNSGLLDQDELRSKWLIQWAVLREKQRVDREKWLEDFQYGYGQIISDLDKNTFHVPIKVGYNVKKKQNIYAVPKGTGGKMRQQERRVVDG